MKNTIDRAESLKKIAIIGHSGSGKSTLAAFLSERFTLPLLHVDSIHFLPDWVEREREDELALMRAFLDENDEKGWVIDGNYTKLEYERRLNEADLIIYMDFNRFVCLYRCFKRSRKYKNAVRPSAAPGCNERFDHDFRMWILTRGRTREKYANYEKLKEKYRGRFVKIRNCRELERFKKSL